jgi:ABC-type antimicrobial peptide transport system permease subunit
MERTHEIGIRRAVGASRRDVTVQFLAEALLMTFSGGAAGVLLGLLVSGGVSSYAGWATKVSAGAVFLGFAVSVAVGLVFGIYPPAGPQASIPSTPSATNEAPSERSSPIPCF